jgi:hypothetical protein
MTDAILLADKRLSCQKEIAGYLAVLENPAGFDRLVVTPGNGPGVAYRAPAPSH